MKYHTTRLLYNELNEKYPIVMTRDLEVAKQWLGTSARGTERYGMVASSGGRRLRAEGVWLNSISPENWFLDAEDDVRSSYYLEETATEFDIQGLELDWTLLAWDANLRFENNSWKYYNFTGSSWKNVNNLTKQKYLINSYRVLLTRARQGIVIYIPEGNKNDITRQKEYYDGIYNYFQEIGIVKLSTFDIADMNFRLQKIPAIYAKIYEKHQYPTDADIKIIERGYQK